MAVDINSNVDERALQPAPEKRVHTVLPYVDPQVADVWKFWSMLRRRGWMITGIVAIGLVLVIFHYEFASESLTPAAADHYWPLLPHVSLGLGGGLLLGLGLAVVMDVRDQMFRDSDDIFNTLELPLLAHIPRIERSLKRSVLAAGTTRLAASLVSYHHPADVVSQRINSLGSHLISMSQNGDGSIVQITSARLGEGKTITLANLAVSLAQAKQRVLVVDADFDSASLHAHFGLDSSDGFSEVIESKVELKDAIHDCAEVPGLHVLPAGRHPELAQQRDYVPLLSMMLKEVRDDFDYVLVDCPPILDAVDASSIACMCDATVLVIKPTRESRVFASSAVRRLRLNDAKVIGVVLNNVQNRYFDERSTSKSWDRYVATDSSNEPIREPGNVAIS